MAGRSEPAIADFVLEEQNSFRISSSHEVIFPSHTCRPVQVCLQTQKITEDYNETTEDYNTYLYRCAINHFDL